MKKLLQILLAVTLPVLLALPVQAKEAGIQMADVTVQGEETVYVTISFTGDIQGSAVGITYSYDETELTVVPEDCAWSQKGMLSDFSKTGNEAVWAVSGTKSLSGPFCVLAFRMTDPQSFTQTQVRCSVLVKDGGTTVGTFEASASVSKVCDHVYGDWTPSGTLGHVRVCEKCGAQQLQSHSLDNGVVTQDPDNPGTQNRVFTCSACGWTKTETISGGIREIPPTVPIATAPPQTEPAEEFLDRPQDTEPESPPIPTYTAPSGNSGQGDPNSSQDYSQNTHSEQMPVTNQPQDYNGTVPTEPDTEKEAGVQAWSQQQEDGSSDPHAAMLEGDPPMAIPVDKDASSQAQTQADPQENESGNGAVITILVIAVIALAAGAGIWFFWKKRKA